MAGLSAVGVSTRYAGVAVMNAPWWYSGDEPADDSADMGEPREDESTQMPAWDPSAILMVANQLVDWATERFVVPHGEHEDPADYPMCVLCRSASVLGSITPDSQSHTHVVPSTPVTWIPVRRMTPEE